MTQNDLVLKHLKSGKPINPLEALQKYGIFRLGARIYDLTCMGHKIKSRLVSKNGKRFAQYSM
jgi:hypothetical protein